MGRRRRRYTVLATDQAGRHGAPRVVNTGTRQEPSAPRVRNGLNNLRSVLSGAVAGEDDRRQRRDPVGNRQEEFLLRPKKRPGLLSRERPGAFAVACTPLPYPETDEKHSYMTIPYYLVCRTARISGAAEPRPLDALVRLELHPEIGVRLKTRARRV